MQWEGEDGRAMTLVYSAINEEAEGKRDKMKGG